MSGEACVSSLQGARVGERQNGGAGLRGRSLRRPFSMASGAGGEHPNTRRRGRVAPPCPCNKSCKTAVCTISLPTPKASATECPGADCCNTRRVRSWRKALGILGLIASLSLVVPAAAMAGGGGGGSAGDQQYVDPLSGSTQPSSPTTTHSQPPPTTTSAPPASTAPSTPSSSTGSSSSTSSATTTSSSVATTTAATTSTATASTLADPASSATLPRTGLDVSLAAVIGIVLFGSGLLVRRVLPDRT